MGWTDLNARFSTLPLVIAGPILRRTEKDNVTVQVVLREPMEVTLKIYDRSGSVLQFQGARTTTGLSYDFELGSTKNLHVVAVTAKPSRAHLALA